MPLEPVEYLLAEDNADPERQTLVVHLVRDGAEAVEYLLHASRKARLDRRYQTSRLPAVADDASRALRGD
jgi:hypothetical protein